MSDDLRIQQRPSAMPYVLGGGLVGAGLGYWGLDKLEATKKLVSDPGKFNSVQEIIDATNKKDEFVKLIEDAGAEHKGAMEKIKGIGEKAAAAIEAERKANGVFRSYDDFYDRCKSRTVTSRVIQILKEQGALEFNKKTYVSRVTKYNSTLYAKSNQ